MNVMIEEGCIGCGMCASTCPDVFSLSGEGLAEVVTEPEKEQEVAVQNAAGNCPVNVIIVN